ncbi:MAG: glycosyltransferase [Limisphaerales bacterium]
MAFLVACHNKDTAEVVVDAAVKSIASQIVVVDWSSTPFSVPKRDTRVTVVTVVNESQWHLGRAYNLGMTAVNADIVWKIDCDTNVTLNALPEAMALPRNSFKTGDWRVGGNAQHLNGNVIMWRRDFWEAGGYDERIQSYGWDDDALYNRLKANGARWDRIEPWWASHIPHNNSQRADGDVMESIQRNRLCEQTAPPWPTTRPSRYKAIDENTFVATFVPEDICQSTLI